MDILEGTQPADRRPPSPLAGKTILVTRARSQAGSLAHRLSSLGAQPLWCPVIKIVPPLDWGTADAVLKQLAGGATPAYDWVIFTSVNGVRFVRTRLRSLGLNGQWFAGVRFAAIGPATARSLRRWGLNVDFVPAEYVAEAIAAGIGDVRGKCILLARAADARPALAILLRRQGAYVDDVTVYRTVAAPPPRFDIVGMLQEGSVDAVTLTSSSTARYLLEILNGARGSGAGESLLARTCVACIGPVTAETARQLGLRVDVVADTYTIDGLLAALGDHFSRRQT